MKKIVSILLVLLLVGCKNPQPEQVDLLIYNTSDNYMSQLAYDLVDLSSDLLEFRIVNSENSQIVQNKQIGELIKANSKIILVNPVDRLGAYLSIKEAKAAEIPIIFFNREPLKEDLDLYDKAFYVGARPEESAILQAQLVKEAFGPSNNLSSRDLNDDGIIQLVILKGEESHQDAEIRTNKIISELEQANYKIEILSISVANWVDKQAYDEMTEMIDKHGEKIELVVSNNDAMAIGAIKAMEDKDFFVDVNNNQTFEFEIDSRIPVVGIDGIPEAIDLIAQGKLYGTVLNDSLDMADKIYKLTKCLLNNERLEDLDFEIVDGTYVWVNYKKISN